MAVEYITSVAVAGTDTGDTLSFSNVNAGAGDLLLVLAVRRVIFAGDILSGVTYGATPLTELIQFNNYDGTNDEGAIAAFYLSSPVGTETVTPTFTQATNQRSAACYVLSGSDQTTPFGTLKTVHFDASFNAINSSANGESGGLFVDCLGIHSNQSGSASVNAAEQTLRHAIGQSSSDMLGTSTAPGASSQSMGWSWTNNQDQRNYIIIPVNPVAGSQVSLRGGALLTLGVG